METTRHEGVRRGRGGKKEDDENAMNKLKKKKQHTQLLLITTLPGTWRFNISLSVYMPCSHVKVYPQSVGPSCVTLP